MASRITCTPAGATDNSYVDLDGADGYFDDTLRAAAWANWVDDDAEMALIQATREIEALGGPKGSACARRPLWPGAPSSTTQALHFPRGGDTTADGDLVIPEVIVRAVCEQAYWLLDRRDNPPLLDRKALQRDGVALANVDGVYEQYRPNARPAHIAPLAWDAIRGVLVRSFPAR